MGLGGPAAIHERLESVNPKNQNSAIRSSQASIHPAFPVDLMFDLNLLKNIVLIGIIFLMNGNLSEQCDWVCS